MGNSWKRSRALATHLKKFESQSRIRAAWGQSNIPGSTVRRDSVPLAGTIEPTDDPLRLRLAEELDYARRMINALGDTLAADNMVVVRHGAVMQSLDIVGQMIGHVSNVVRAEEPDEVVQSIGMSELKARLLRRSL